MSQCSSVMAISKVCILISERQLKNKLTCFFAGAQVLAASLRDSGTTKKLAVIVPADEAHRLLPQTITQLEVSSYRMHTLTLLALV
jgi:hypothetical protein